LRATATSDPLFRCDVALQNEVSQPLIAHSCTTSFAAASAVGVALVCKGRLLPFLCAALLAILRRAGKAPVLCAAARCVRSPSALGSGRGGAAGGLKARGPVLQPQVGDLGVGFAIEDRAQWRRGCGGPAWCPLGLALAPLAADNLMTGKSAGPCGVFAPSFDMANRCLCRLITLLDSFT